MRKLREVCKYALVQLGATDITNRAYFGKSPVKILRKVVQIYHGIERRRDAGLQPEDEDDFADSDLMQVDAESGLPVFRARHRRPLRCPPLPSACAVERNASRQEIKDCNYEALKEMGGDHAQSVHGPWDTPAQHLAFPFRTDTDKPAQKPVIVHPSETAAMLQRAAQATEALKEMAEEVDEAEDDEIPEAERQHELSETGERDGTQETAPQPARELDRCARLSLGVRQSDESLRDEHGSLPHWCGVPNAFALGCQCVTCSAGRLPLDRDLNRFRIDEGGTWHELWSALKSEYAMSARIGDVVVSPSVGRVMNVFVGGVYRLQQQGGVYQHTDPKSNLRGTWVRVGGHTIGFDFSAASGSGGKATVLLQGRMPADTGGDDLQHAGDERLIWRDRTTPAGDFRERADVRVWRCGRDAALPQPSFVQDWRAISWLNLPPGSRGLDPDPDIEACTTEAQYAREHRQQRGQRLADPKLQILCMDYGEGSHVESALADGEMRQTVISGGILHQEFPIGAQLAEPPWTALPCEELFVRGLGANRKSVYKYYTSPAKKRQRFVHSHGVVAYALALFVVRRWLAECKDRQYSAELQGRRTTEPGLGPADESDSGMAFVRARACSGDAELLLTFLEDQDWSARANRQLWHLNEFIYNRAQMVHLTMAQSAGDSTAHRAFMNWLKLLLYCSDAHPLKQREFTSLDCQQAQMTKFYDEIIARDIELTTYREDNNELLPITNNWRSGKGVGAMPGDVVHEVGIGVTKSKDPRSARDIGLITACMAMSTQDGALAAHECKQYEYHHAQSTRRPSFTSSVGACWQFVEGHLADFFQEQADVPEPCLRPRSIYGMMRAMHHADLRKTGRKPPVERKKPTDDEWHSVWSVYRWQQLKDKCKGYKLCQKRECFDPGCQRGRFCPKSQTQLKKAPPASSGASLAHAGAPS